MKNQLILKLTIDPTWIHDDKEIIRLEQSSDDQYLISKRTITRSPPANKSTSTIRKYKDIRNELLAGALDNLFQTTIPAFPDFEEYLDGYTTELSFGGAFGGATFNWHCQPPDEWEPLGKFVNYLTELIESLEQGKHEREK